MNSSTEWHHLTYKNGGPYVWAHGVGHHKHEQLWRRYVRLSPVSTKTFYDPEVHRTYIRSSVWIKDNEMD